MLCALRIVQVQGFTRNSPRRSTGMQTLAAALARPLRQRHCPWSSAELVSATITVVSFISMVLVVISSVVVVVTHAPSADLARP